MFLRLQRDPRLLTQFLKSLVDRQRGSWEDVLMILEVGWVWNGMSDCNWGTGDASCSGPWQCRSPRRMGGAWMRLNIHYWSQRARSQGEGCWLEEWKIRCFAAEDVRCSNFWRGSGFVSSTARFCFACVFNLSSTVIGFGNKLCTCFTSCHREMWLPTPSTSMRPSAVVPRSGHGLYISFMPCP